MTTLLTPTRRGLSLLELLLALSITAMVATAVSAMMSAVITGVSTRRDSRSLMVRANAAQTRLAAYITPSRAVLDSDGSTLVLWLEDARDGGTVHATEVRWLKHDASKGTIDVCFVDFPDAWQQTAKDLADRQYVRDADWMAVLNSYNSNGWVSSLTLVDGLERLTVRLDAAEPLDSRHVDYELDFTTSGGSLPTHVSATVRLHRPPVS